MTEHEAELMGEWVGSCNNRIKSTKISRVFNKMLKKTASNELEEHRLERVFNMDYRIADFERRTK